METESEAKPTAEGGGVDADTPPAEQPETATSSTTNARCCTWFEGNPCAQGLAFCAIFRAGIIISNLFLLSSLLHLANAEAGCLDDDGEIVENCEGRVYGQKPGSLVANIAVISGVMSALFMPLGRYSITQIIAGSLG